MHGEVTKGDAAPELNSVTTSIDRLPNELLINTFKYAHVWIFDGPPENQCFRDWMPQLLNVCTRWRNIILSVSDLWNILNISPDSKLEALSHCLSLCGSSPLDVRFWNDCGPELVTDFLGLLRPKLATIKHLALHEFHLGYESSPFGDLLSFDMPILQELRIIPSASSNGSYCNVDMHRYPVLQRLELTRAVCPLNIKTLRILRLRDCFLPLSLDGFARILEHCTQLEELQLDYSLHPVVFPSPPEMLPTLFPAKLDNLRILVIDHSSASTTSAAIAQIDARALTTLRISCADRHQADVENLLRTIFPINAPCMFPRISATPANVQFYLKGRTNTCTIEMGEWTRSGAAAASTPLYLSLWFDFEQTCTLLMAIQETSRLLRDIPVSGLAIDVHTPVDISSAVWEEVFSNMPFLERLDIMDDGCRTTMCEGLRCASREQLCCPRLASIGVRDFPSGDPAHRDGVLDDPALWLNLLRDTLRERAEAGVKLQEFVLRESRSSCEKDESHIVRYKALLVQLEPFVETWWYEDTVFSGKRGREGGSREHEVSD